MSAPVHVLAILDAHADGIAEAAKRARGQNRVEIQAGHAEFVEVRSAVAELIEADNAYDDARRRWSGEKYEGDDYGVHGSDFIRCLCCEGESGAGILNHGVTHEPDCEVAALERAESRRSAALARAGGAS